MRPIALAHVAQVAQIALAYVLHKPAITSVIIGAKSDKQVKDNLAATTLRLSSDELGVLIEGVVR